MSECIRLDFENTAESTLLRQAYTSNGLCIEGGGTHTLSRRVGGVCTGS